MGWYGREYLYRHLVDEYWEIKEEHQHLREYCRAFHHHSKNLKQVEEKAADEGHVLTADKVGRIMIYPRLTNCVSQFKVNDERIKCPGRVVSSADFQQCVRCQVKYPAVGLLYDAVNARKKAVWLPSPSQEKMEIAKQILPPRAVGVTARGRRCYGRNLTPEFYERLIWLLEDMGYNPVWLGEKVTTQPCPSSRIIDFSRMAEARDFELTLALVKQMEFTVQFWTASTRLAGLMGTPFLIFESPDQIWGRGQEGYRLHLASRGPKKLVAAHFLNVLEDNTKALSVVERAVREIEKGDFSTMLGMVDEVGTRNVIYKARHRITWF